MKGSGQEGLTVAKFRDELNLFSVLFDKFIEKLKINIKLALDIKKFIKENNINEMKKNLTDREEKLRMGTVALEKLKKDLETKRYIEEEHIILQTKMKELEDLKLDIDKSKEDINKLREENKKELDDLKISLNTMEGLLKKGDITIEELNKIINREI